MTRRLYYHDSYVAAFEADVIDHLDIGGQSAVVLDRTFFYPTPGGQPCDRGVINGVPVTEVSIREGDDAIIHLLAGEIHDHRVQAEIDWPRRFDHMQQHTGQHILSAACVRAAQAGTIGFHLGEESSTIDLDVESLSRPQVERVEDLANDVIFGDRRVTSSTLTPDQTASLGAEGRDGRPLRKTKKPGSALRIVDIEGFDRCACGGTHVKRAGEIGMIKIVRLEHRGRGLRVEFRCGRRALTDYRVKHDLISKLAADLTVGYWDVCRAVDSLRHEFKSFRRQVREAGERLLEHEARDLLRGAQRYEKLCVVSAVFSERDRRQLGRLAKKLIEQPGVVVLFGVADVKSHLLFARAEDLELDMRPALASALSVLGAQGGGGRPAMAQGGGPAADEEQIRAAIGHALQLLTNDA